MKSINIYLHLPSVQGHFPGQTVGENQRLDTNISTGKGEGEGGGPGPVSFRLGEGRIFFENNAVEGHAWSDQSTQEHGETPDLVGGLVAIFGDFHHWLANKVMIGDFHN